MPNKSNGEAGGQADGFIERRKRTSRTAKESSVSHEPLYLRTVRAFGVFPSALLLSGYGENDVIKYRAWLTNVDDGVGGIVERKLEMSTESELGLPRGSDPLVLVGLLKLLFDRGAQTNSVSFRKTELMSLLGWQMNADSRNAVEGALKRYFATSYRGTNLWTSSER